MILALRGSHLYHDVCLQLIERKLLPMDFQTLLTQEFVLLDGGMGTMLHLTSGEIPEELSLTQPLRIKAVHDAYLAAGAQILYANTFGANRIKLQDVGLNAIACVSAAVTLAKSSAGNRALVALDIGPTGQLLQPVGTLSFEEAYEAFKEVVLAGVAAGADVIVIETMSDLLEAKAAVLAAKENSSLPVLCTMTFTETGRTFTGCPVSAMALTFEGLGVDAIGMNCSLGPAEFVPLLCELSKWTHLPLIAKPNAGLPDPVTGEYHVSAAEFAEAIAPLTAAGVQFFGGCCGTTPDYIVALRTMLAEKTRNRSPRVVPNAVCSGTRTVLLDMPRVIGERINPTGKKAMKQALLEGNMDYLRSEAISQTEAGADLLDVNVGTTGIDEAAMLPQAVQAIMEVTDLPLQLDSSDPAAIEAALRIYPGKPIVNSVNGKAASLETVLPLVRHYGAAIVGLTLDEDGIPETAEGRFAIGKRILERALSLGIPRENVCIDCLTLTASTADNAAATTLSALRRVREELGLQTVLGVSNISFGLPNRPVLNRSFLAMALTSGLTLPILNPKSAEMMDTVRAYRLLGGYDANCAAYIEQYRDIAASSAVSAPEPQQTQTLSYAITHGLRQEAALLTKRSLEAGTAPLDIVNDMLIPALDTVGEEYERGTLFLPQLLQAATAAQSAFGVLKASMQTVGSAIRGKIILATVQGDVHDIGKNIVKLLLENYGFQVIDLGKDVPPEKIVRTAISNQAPLVGLSALMTTTVGAMAETIALLHAEYPACKTVVGGAVLTEEYAAQIGADCYARDAKATVDYAKQVFGEVS